MIEISIDSLFNLFHQIPAIQISKDGFWELFSSIVEVSLQRQNFHSSRVAIKADFLLQIFYNHTSKNIWSDLKRKIDLLKSSSRSCLCGVEKESLKQLLQMLPSSSWERQNITAGCLPFESYFSFAGITDPETPNLTAEKPQVDAAYLGDPLQGASTGVNALNMFAQPRGIQKLQRRNIPRKMRWTPKNTLVLELEGTLALSSLTAVWDGASTFTIPFQDRCYQVSIKLRPHLPEFLEALAEIYEIFVFTTAKQDYADQMLKVLGPQRKLIRHQLYQEDCLCSHGSYVKDLSVVERDLDRTVAVATYLQAFPYQMSNVVVVPKWEGNSQDKELLRLIPVLQTISQAVDIRTEIERNHRGRRKFQR